MKYIQKRLGHGSIQITADVYSHVSRKIESRNMKKFEDKISDISGWKMQLIKNYWAFVGQTAKSTFLTPSAQ